jgi:hypothetical protein
MDEVLPVVMAGLVPAIHVWATKKTWMPGTRPGMTKISFIVDPHPTGDPS